MHLSCVWQHIQLKRKTFKIITTANTAVKLSESHLWSVIFLKQHVFLVTDILACT